MPNTDVESNLPCGCSKSPTRCGAKTLARKVGTGLFILVVLLGSGTVLLDHEGLELTQDTCPVPGAYEGKLWKVAREFRRLTRSAIRKLKRVNIQDTLFQDGLKEWSMDGAGVDACTIKDGSSLSHAYPCQCGGATCSDGQACFESQEMCKGSMLELEIVSASHAYDADWRLQEIEKIHGVDWVTHTDPFVECFLEGKHESTKFETPHLKDDHHPVWNFKHEYTEYDGEDLICSLFDHDVHDWWPSENDKIATVTWDGGKLSQPWRHDEELKLVGTTDKIRREMHAEAALRIKAFVHVPEPAPRRGPFWWACEHRVRKDWVDLTEAEKVLYLEAINKLKTTPREGASDAGPGNNIYDTFVMIHEQNDNKKYAHQTAGFLAWHRKFLIELESELRAVDDKFKCVTIPYWDWTSETFGCKKHFDAGSALDTPGCDTYHAASDLLTRFGGPGDATKTAGAFGSSGSGPVGCVTTGPFAGWVDHHGRCLSRGVNWKVSAQKPFVGRIEMLKILHYPDYGNQYDKEGFRVVLEGTPHGATHNYLGGHMRSFISPADPIFFSHHCYIDKLWTIWQDCHGHDTVEVKELLQTQADNVELHKYYEPTHDTHYKNDKATDPMLFKLKFSIDIGGTDTCPMTGAQCEKTTEACAACVHGKDGWCRSNPWDQTCCSMCTQPECATACGAGTPPDVDMNEVGNELLKEWVTSEKVPADVQTVKAMAGDRSYSYAQDEIEKHLLEMAPESLGECKIETKHASALMSLEVLEETRRFHHKHNKQRGEAAKSYAAMISKAFANTKKEMSDADSEKQYQSAMKAAQEEECAMMASQCDGDYVKEYHCEADKPWDYKMWLGADTVDDLVTKPLGKKVFQDPCCAGQPLPDEATQRR